jgi:hypothetical protein
MTGSLSRRAQLYVIRIVGFESSWVHLACQPLIGLLYLSQVITMMENLVEWRLAGETEILGEKPPQRHFDHHKSHLIPGRRGGKPATNRLSYGAIMFAPYWSSKIWRYFTTAYWSDMSAILFAVT